MLSSADFLAGWAIMAEARKVQANRKKGFIEVVLAVTAIYARVYITRLYVQHFYFFLAILVTGADENGHALWAVCTQYQ